MDLRTGLGVAGKGTALITGASSGLGAEFARQLARRGYDLVLVARRRERLEELIEELLTTCKIAAEALVADLSQEADLRRVEERIASLQNLALLINNAGFGLRGRFHKSQIEEQLEMIQVHVIASVRLCRAALPVMISRGAGAIINVASMAALIPTASVTYSATKAYLVAFSRSLQIELEGSGVQVQALCPGFTMTEFHDAPRSSRMERTLIPGWLWLRPETVVRASLRGLERGETVCIPGMIYKLAAWLIAEPLTAPLVRLIVRHIYLRRKSEKAIKDRTESKSDNK